MLAYFLIVVCTVLVIYIIGSVITNLFSVNLFDRYENYLVKIISGLIAVVFLFSVIKTRGNTVNLILIIPFFLFLYHFRSVSKIQQANPGNFLNGIRNEILPLLITIIFCLFWFIWQYTLYANNLNGNIVYAPYGDSIFYIDIINSLKDLGAENTNTIKNEFFNEVADRTPYHYFELWLSAAMSFFSGANSAIVFLLLLPVLFFSFNSMLVYSIARNLKVKGYLLFLLPALIFFIPYFIRNPLVLKIFPGNFATYLDNYLYSYISLLKFQVYLFFLLGMIFCYSKYRAAFIFLALILPIATFTAVPAAMGIVSVYIFYCIKTKTFVRNSWITILAALAIVIFLGFYYRKAFLSPGGGIVEASTGTSYIRTMINILGMTFVQAFYIYGPYFIFLFLFSWMIGQWRVLYSKENIWLYSYFIVAFCCALFGWAMIHRQLNSHQFFSNFFINSMIALFIFQVLQVISSLLQSRKILPGIVFAVMIACFIVYSGIWNYNNHIELVNGRKAYSRSFYNEVSQELNKNLSNKTGVCFYSSEDYKRTPDIINSQVHWPAQVFKLKYDDFFLVSLTDPFQSYNDYSSLDKARNDALKKKSLFSNWLEKKHIADSSLLENAADQQMSFIQDNKIQFGIATPGAIIPPQIAAMKEKEITDSISGYRFFLLKPVK